MNFKTLAAIDIGSNGIRLLINTVELHPGKSEFKNIAYLRVPIRLGEDVFTTGKISAPKASQLKDAIYAFAHLLPAYRVDHYKACATSAMREAKNGEEIIAKVCKASGLDIPIIDGIEESNLLSSTGTFDACLPEQGACLFVDVGGGSTEIVVHVDKKEAERYSFSVGTVRMLVDAVDPAEVERMKSVLSYLAIRHTPVSLVASGGNINKVKKILDKKECAPVLFDELAGLYAKLAPISVDERQSLFQLKYYRADVIVHALKIFLTIGEHCPSLKELYIPKVGISDGLIRSLCRELYPNNC